MTLSTAAKAGGLITASIGLPTSIYLFYDYSVSLYEVEQEVIDKDIKLFIDENDSSNSLTIKTLESTSLNDPKLSEGYSWSCLMEFANREKTRNIDPSFIHRLSKNLFTSESSSLDESKRKENKELLVRVCAKHRTENSSHSSVKSIITFREEVDASGPRVFFTDSQLDVLTTWVDN